MSKRPATGSGPFRAVFFVIFLGWFTPSLLQGQPPLCQTQGVTCDLLTGFEFDDTSGSFTLGSSPTSATFDGGAAQSVPATMVRNGTHSWMVGAGNTATITLETPAQQLELWFLDEDETVQSVLTLYDVNDQVIGTPQDGRIDIWKRLRISTVQHIKRVTLENRAPGGGGGAPWAAIDDFAFEAGEPSTADLSITKADSADPVSIGSQITYTITVTNHDTSDATGVTVTDTLPAGVSFVSATSSQGSCSEDTGTVTCNLGTLAASGSATITLVVSADQDGTINNTASVTATESDPDTSNNSASEETIVDPLTDLSIEKTDSVDPVLLGDNVTYTITVTNSGPEEATGVTVTDTLPASVDFVSATPTQGNCNEVSGTITCAVGTLANSAQATITIVVTTTTDGELTNSASVSSNETDPDASDNNTSENTTVNPGADLSLTKADSRDPAKANEELTYTIVATNSGPSAASGVTVTDNLPTGVDFVSANATQGSCSEVSGTVTCNLDSLGDQAAATVTIVVRPTSEANISNTATVTAAESDPNPDNNSATEQTTVSPASAADLSITKSASADSVQLGEEINYTLTITNNGPADASAVTATDTLPGGVDFVSASNECSHVFGTVTCSIGSLTSSQSSVVAIVVSPRELGELVNTASVSANEDDPNSDNNSGSAQTTVDATVEYGPANLLFTQFANGEIQVAAAGGSEAQQISIPNRTRIVLVNNSDTADSGVVRFKDGDGNLTEVPIGANLTHTIGYALQPWSTTEVETDGTGALKTGIIEVISDRGEESQIEGTEAFEILGRFVSVASAAQASAHQIYVSVTDEENTGVALLNPDPDNSVTVDVTLLDAADQQRDQKEILLQPNQQLLTFVNESDLFEDFFALETEDFQGRLKLDAQDEREFALLGLLQKLAGEQAGALIAVSTQLEGDPGRLIFAQYANGIVGAAAAAFESQQEGVPNRTRLVLINDGEETDTGTLQFQDESGTLSPVPIQGEVVDTLPYSLDGGTTTEVETDGTGPLQFGVVEVNSDLASNSRVMGSEVFEILGNFVSVTNSPPRQSQQAYVSVTDDENTGVALYNPDRENPLTVTLILLDNNGTEQTRKDVVLQAGEQLVEFMDQERLFKDFFDAHDGDFTGTLNIHAEEGRRAAVLGLLQKRASGALIAVTTSPNAFGGSP